MRPWFTILAVLLIFPQLAYAQAAPGSFENIAIGQPLADLHATLGDPVRVLTSGATTIWRYISHGNGIYTDLVVRNNVVQSITLVSRFDGVHYVDSKGIAFGMTPEQVRAKLGPATRESTNSDDGSLDLWYYAQPYAWVYEFHSAKLDFIQLIAAPSLLQTFKPGAAAAPNDGTSPASAIWIRPSNLLTNTSWIETYLTANACENGGHWKAASSKFIDDSAKNDPFAFTIVHANCTAGGTDRDFYFDTRGSLTSTGSKATIYIDPRQPLDIPGSPSPSPSPSPS